MFTTFKPWEERTGPDSSAGEMLADAMDRFMQLDNASAFVIQPPAIQSLGRASGFTLKLQDRGGVGRETLTAARDQMLGIASQSPVIANLRPEDQGPSPEVEV